MKTPININKDKLEDEIFKLLYINILLVWERKYKLQKTGYSIRNKYFKEFIHLRGLGIYVAKDKKGIKKDINKILKEKDLSNSKDNYFVFQSNTSYAYDIFRHLRNSVAHGNYTKEKIGKNSYLNFKDTYRNKLTMFGQVKCTDLEDLIFTLYKSKS